MGMDVCKRGGLGVEKGAVGLFGKGSDAATHVEQYRHENDEEKAEKGPLENDVSKFVDVAACIK